MFLNFRRKKLLILRDNEIGPGTDFSQEKIALILRSSKMFLNFRGKKLLNLGRTLFKNKKRNARNTTSDKDTQKHHK